MMRKWRRRRRGRRRWWHMKTHESIACYSLRLSVVRQVLRRHIYWHVRNAFHQQIYYAWTVKQLPPGIASNRWHNIVSLHRLFIRSPNWVLSVERRTICGAFVIGDIYARTRSKLYSDLTSALIILRTTRATEATLWFFEFHKILSVRFHESLNVQ